MRIDTWINAERLESGIAELREEYAAAKPFPHIVLERILKPAKTQALKRALERQEFSRKEADLFSFSQTADLTAAQDRTIREFIALLRSPELARIVSTITGIEVAQGKADASGFIYGPGDHLLCHDDGVSTRRVAYICNLTAMPARQGGALALFSCRDGRPKRIAKRIQPRRNTLVLFGVTRRSHHMVEEVLSGKRLTITGWFHA